MMGVGTIEGGFQFFHHDQEVTGGIGSNFKCKVALQEWGTEAQALLLSMTLFFGTKSMQFPIKSDLWKVRAAEDLPKVPSDKK